MSALLRAETGCTGGGQEAPSGLVSGQQRAGDIISDRRDSNAAQAVAASPPTSASFCFNSYQDIIFCQSDSSFESSSSIFNAAELSNQLGLLRLDALGENPASSFKINHLNNLVASAASNSCRSNTNKHLRQKSIGGVKISVAENNSDDSLHSNKEAQQQQQSAPDNSALEIRSNQADETKTMSQTIQSIQSLSMQLNRAASQCELTGFQSPLPASNLNNQTNFKHSNQSSSKLSRLVGKKAARVKELLLQNLGKADKTTDDLFKLYEENFYKQQAQAMKLQKEFKSYVGALKIAQEADKSLNQCIQQSTNDYQTLARHDLICENLNQMEHLNEDLMDKLRGQVMLSINEYLTQFNELKEKISKRHRKLIDYDSSKRIYEYTLAAVNKKRQQQSSGQQDPLRSFRSVFMLSSASAATASSPASHQGAQADPIQSATSQLVDEARLLKLREQYNYCKIMYETLNSELHEELPMIYDKKMKHLLMTLQNYFSLEAQFHSNAGKLFATASDVIDELPISLHHHHHHLQAARDDDEADYAKQQAIIGGAGSSGMGSSRGNSSMESSTGSPEVDDDEVEVIVGEHGIVIGCTECAEPSQGNVEGLSVQAAPEGAVENCAEQDEDERRFCSNVVGLSVDEDRDADCGDAEEQPASQSQAASDATNEAKLESVECCESNENGDKGYKLLYKVKTSYKYLAEDVDELCFESDEIIQVIELARSKEHEQEEGWLMGIREVNGQRGLFPANFTQPI